MNSALWCWFLSCYTGLTTRDCKRNCPILLESGQAGSSRTTRVISERHGTDRHLCEAVPWPGLSDQQWSSCHVLWFLISHPKVLASLSRPSSSLCSLHPWLFLIFMEVLIIFLQLCLFCFLIFLSISTQSYMLSPVLSIFTLGTNSHPVNSELISAQPRRREAQSRNEKQGMRLTSLQLLCCLWARLVLPHEPRATYLLHTNSRDFSNPSVPRLCLLLPDIQIAEGTWERTRPLK